MSAEQESLAMESGLDYDEITADDLPELGPEDLLYE
jgi:hypothetical protein